MAYNYALRPGTTQKINTNNSSAASAAFGDQTNYIRIVGSANFHFVLGASPTASATSALLPSGEVEILKVSPGEKIAWKCNKKHF